MRQETPPTPEILLTPAGPVKGRGAGGSARAQAAGRIISRASISLAGKAVGSVFPADSMDFRGCAGGATPGRIGLLAREGGGGIY